MKIVGWPKAASEGGCHPNSECRCSIENLEYQMIVSEDEAKNKPGDIVELRFGQGNSEFDGRLISTGCRFVGFMKVQF